jgi:eukaryotic-like serine/threonine-protein kinase
VQVIPVLGGRYRLGPEIGSGGMGAVHRAWDERFNREVAIKILHAGSDSVERERLRREAQYLAHLDHPNLVAVLDAGTDTLRKREAVWFAMELVEGPDLRSVVRQDGPMDGPAVRRILTGLLAALGALHAAGVVHRDLKPANVLLTAEPATGRWDVKLVDLGIAQHMRTDHLTSTGQIVGTAAYLSPEQVSGHPIGAETDVYALGLLAVEALTGRIAFPGAPAESAAARLVRGPDLPPDLDPAWRTVLRGMTALDPADRPTVTMLTSLVRRLPDATRSLDSAEVTTALMTAVLPPIQEAQPTALLDARPVRETTRRRRQPRRHLMVAAFLLLVVAAAGGWIAALSGGGSPSADANPLVSTSAPASRAASRTPAPAPTVTVTAAAAEPAPTPSATAPAEQPATNAVTTSSMQGADALRRWEKALRDRLHQHRHR